MEGGEASVGDAALSLGVAALGAAVTALPGAVRASGFVGGNALLAVVALANGWMLACLMACARRTGCASYQALAGHYLGRGGRAAVAATLVLVLFGGVVLYVVVACDALTPILVDLSRFTDGEPVRISRSGLAAGLLLAVAPLCLSESLHGLRHVAAAALACILYLACVLCVRLAGASRRHALPWLASPGFLTAVRPGGTWDTVAVLGVAFCAQFSALQVHAELAHPTPRRASAVISLGLGGVFLANAVVANAGYLLFGDDGTPDDILGGGCFPDDDVAVGVARVALGVCLVLKVPILMVPLVHALDEAKSDLARGDAPEDEETDEDLGGPSDRPDEDLGGPSGRPDEDLGGPSGRPDEEGVASLEAPLLARAPRLRPDRSLARAACVACVLATAWVCATALPNVDAALDAVGNTCNCLLNYIFPSTFFLLSDLHRREGPPRASGASHAIARGLDRLKALVCLLLGLTVLVNYVARIL